MNRQLMEILDVIQDGLKGDKNGYISDSPADSLCTKVVTANKCGANIDEDISCGNCVIGYSTNKSHATQIIQVFKNI